MPIYGPDHPCDNYTNGFCSCFTPDDSYKGNPIWFDKPRCADWPNTTYVEFEDLMEHTNKEDDPDV